MMKTTARVAMSLGWALAIVGLLSACGPKKKECEALTSAMKEARGSFDEAKAEDLKKDAETFDKAAKKLGAVEVTVPELKDYRDKYKKILDDFAEASRLAADPAKRKEASALLDKLKDTNEKDLYIDTLKFCTK